MKTQKFKRTVSLLLAMLMCVTTLFGMGTTAFAAEETDEVYTMPLLYPFPKGRKNSDFYPRLVQPKKIFARLYIPKLFYLGRLRYRSV